MEPNGEDLECPSDHSRTAQMPKLDFLYKTGHFQASVHIKQEKNVCFKKGLWDFRTLKKGHKKIYSSFLIGIFHGRYIIIFFFFNSVAGTPKDTFEWAKLAKDLELPLQKIYQYFQLKSWYGAAGKKSVLRIRILNI